MGIKLSQCMIVKNEEKNIEKALSWAKPIAFEQIVVDTGSTDRTVELAKKLGAKVYHFKWVDDFSAAKNFAIEHASGDWIAFLDADEYLGSQQEAESFLKLLQRLEDSYEEEKGPHIISASVLCLDDEGKVFSKGVEEHVFRNMSGLRFHRKIHEVIDFDPSMRRKPVYYNAQEEISIYHTGYAGGEETQIEKSKRNIRLLEQILQQNPNDYNSRYYLGIALFVAGEKKRAEKLFYEVIHYQGAGLGNIIRDQAYFYLMKSILNEGDLEREQELLRIYEGIQICSPDYPDPDYLMGAWFARRREWAPSIQYYLQAIQKMDSYKGQTPMEAISQLENIFSTLAVAYYNLGDLSSTVQYSVTALRTNKRIYELLCMLLNLLQTEPGESEHGEGTFKILQGIYDFTNLKDKVIVYQCANKVGFQGLADNIYQRFTEEEKKIIKGSFT